MAIEIVSFPIKYGGSFHSYVSHYQRVATNNWLVVWNMFFSIYWE